MMTQRGRVSPGGALTMSSHSQSSQPIYLLGGANASNSTEPIGRGHLSPASPPRGDFLFPRNKPGSILTYRSVPKDGDFSRFRLRHISLWLSHPVLGLYRNLQSDGIQNLRDAQIRHTEPRQRQQNLLRALFGLSRPARDFFFSILQCYFRSCRGSME